MNDLLTQTLIYHFPIMSITKHKINRAAEKFRQAEVISSLENNAKCQPEYRESVPVVAPYTKEGQENRIRFMQEQIETSIDHLTGKSTFDKHAQLEGNIENFVGMTQIPTGIAGPMCVNGSDAKGDFFVPLATTEGALIASYSRGMKACRMSGSITSVCFLEGVQRSPYFKFESMTEMGKFVLWVLEELDSFKEIVKASSNYAELNDLKVGVEGNSVILTFEYTTGDAAGQNMVTICTQAICDHILQHTPITPTCWFIESNYSGDKKATARSFGNVRGKKVSSEIVLQKEIVQKVLKAEPSQMVEYWRASTLGVIQSGSIGAQGHVANGLTALFLACGQDVACISEASIGITRMELTNAGDLYAAVTLPGLIVGTVGGGTQLPTQKECLQMMDCLGAGKARKFAEICGALVLSGEISIAAAMSAGHFSRAHEQLGRKK